MSSMMEASDRIKNLGEIEQPILSLQTPLAVWPNSIEMDIALRPHQL